MITPPALDEYHDEIVAALREIGNPRLGAAIAEDRGSSLEHLGIRFPALRKRVKLGFSFYELSEEEILAVWDGLWRTSPYGDVLFAALEYYAPLVRKRVSPSLWPVVRHWPDRVDNWCHCDGLELALLLDPRERVDEVYAQLEAGTARRTSGYGGSRSSASFTTPGRTRSSCLSNASCRSSRPVSTTSVSTFRRQWAGCCARWGAAYPDRGQGVPRGACRDHLGRRVPAGVERRSPGEQTELRALHEAART